MTRWIFALIFAIVFAQFPSFSQQYVQRLGGAVDALEAVISDFDEAAEEAGLTREQALDELDGSAFLDAHQGDMSSIFARGEKLASDYEILLPLSDLDRLTHLYRFRDVPLMKGAIKDFHPAIPVTISGALITFIGLAIGYFIGAFLGRVLGRVFGRSRRYEHG